MRSEDAGAAGSETVRSPDIERAGSAGRWGWRGASACVRSPDIEPSLVARGAAQDAQAAVVARLEWEQLAQVHMVRSALIPDRFDCGTADRPTVAETHDWPRSELRASDYRRGLELEATGRELAPRPPEIQRRCLHSQRRRSPGKKTGSS